MTTMISEVYDALLAAGAPDDKARRAAEAIASSETKFLDFGGRIDHLDGRVSALDGRMNAIEGRMGGLEGRMNALEGRLSAVEARVGMLTWAVGINLAISLAILGKLLTISGH